MLVAGIVLTIAFIMTALTLSQLSSLEQAAASEKTPALVPEWRFLHQRLETSLNTAVTVDTSNETFTAVTFPSIAATFRNIAAEKGYDVVIRLAGSEFARSEADLRSGQDYDAWTSSGSYHFEHPHDDTDDGILWQAPCRDSDAPATGCIGGVYIYLHITDATSTLEETILFDVNRG